MPDYWQQPEVITWTQLLLNSYEQLLGKSLIERTGNPTEEAEKLFFAPLMLLSHDNQANPLLNYGNQTALNLWEMDWETLIKTPSRQTVADPDTQEQEQRQQMLKQVQEHGYMTNYQGIRVTYKGKRMKITNVTVWNIIDQNHSYCGQGATCIEWYFL